jgi:hypothetical protein
VQSFIGSIRHWWRFVILFYCTSRNGQSIPWPSLTAHPWREQKSKDCVRLRCGNWNPAACLARFGVEGRPIGLVYKLNKYSQLW